MSRSANTFAGEGEIRRNATLLDFWRCLFSDLCDDAVRDIFAAWAVGTLLGLPLGSTRDVSWAVTDFVLPHQTRIEVKSRALWQSPSLKPRSAVNVDPSLLCFSGLQAGSTISASCKTGPRFKSDFYIFCLYAQNDPAAGCDFDVSNCEFYFMTRAELESLKVGHSVTLATLRNVRSPMSAKEFQAHAKSGLSKHLKLPTPG